MRVTPAPAVLDVPSPAHPAGVGDRRTTFAAVLLVLLAALPASVLRFWGWSPGVVTATVLFGVAIVGAAFALSWAAEAAERDIPRALALTAVALLAVLPEYAVDIIFAWKAGKDPAFTAYAAANMTGSNRLLLGLGWPAVGLLAWLFHRQRSVPLDRANVPALAFLAAATAYSFLLPIRGAISLMDSAILLALFIGYAAVTARAEQVEPELVGPAAVIGALSTPWRRLAVGALLAFAGMSIAMSAEPFADGLVHTGRSLHIDEFLLVQWLAPLASEAPEFLIAALLARRGKGASALGLLLAAKVNQWTVLVSSLPIAYSVGSGHLAALPLDTRQAAEVLLTAAQSLFGLSVLATMSLTLRRSALLAGLFLVQLAMGGVIRVALGSAGGAMDELLMFSVCYLLLAAVFAYRARATILSVVRKTIRGEQAAS